MLKNEEMTVNKGFDGVSECEYIYSFLYIYSDYIYLAENLHFS